MTCSTCGTPIADKALVCYRCGAPTARPGPVAPMPRRRGGRLWSVLALLVLVTGALYLGQTVTGQVPRALSWSVAVLGVVVVAWWLAVRARRRP